MLLIDMNCIVSILHKIKLITLYITHASYAISCNLRKYLLLLQKASKYPEAHPLSQCPLVELQGPLSKQCPLQCVLQPIPNISCSQPVVNKSINYKITNLKPVKIISFVNQNKTTVAK